MPPAPKKDCSVILFDLAAEPREKAIQTLVKICCNNFANDSKDLTKLILLNSNDTKNRLNGRYGGYEHINEVADDCTTYDAKLLLQMIDGNSGTRNATWLEGLQVALQNLEDEFQDIAGIITYQVLFITDLKQSPEKIDDSKVNKIVQALQRLEAFLYVVGPNVEPPFMIKSQEDVKLWMKNLKVDDKDKNLRILGNIISKTKNSVVCDYKIGIHLFFSYRNSGGSQPWQVPLGMGCKLEIPAQTVKILNDVIPCRLVSSAGGIRQQTWIDAEDEFIEVDASDVISGMMRHEKFVRMPDNKMFQVENPRSFKVLCFTNSANIPEYIMRGGGCYCVLPNSTPEKNEALDILIDCLAKQNKYVVARRIYNKNFVPKIVVLVPKPDYNPKCFLLTFLPFAEDIRLNYKEKKVEMAPKTEPIEEINAFLDSVNVDNDNCKNKISLGINMMLSYNRQMIVNKAADKYLGKYMNLAEVDIDMLEKPKGGAFESLAKIWPERKIEEVKKTENNNDQSDDDFNW